MKQNLLSSAIKVALATTVVFSLQGCLVEGSTSVSTSGGSVTTVSNPTGSVTGTVQDTNGNPLSGVTVYLAGDTATTDAGGVYTFSDVPATNTVGADGQIISAALSVSVAAPTGYLGATVTVAPQAQIDGTNAGSTTDSGATVFVSGYVASAGVAVLPALTTTVSGTLRDNSTGEAIAATDVRLDLESVRGVNQQQTQNGVATTYQTFAYTATTDATGNFSIANVPDDAELRFMVAGFGVNSVGANVGGTGDDVSTVDETLISVGNLMVSPITANDTINPFVASVTGVVAQSASPGAFNDNIDGTTGIVINFSETMVPAEVNTNSVVVWDDANGYQTAATIAMAANSLTVTTPAAIPAGAIVHVFLLKDDFQDLSANALTTGAGVGFDSNVSSSSSANYVQLTMQIFQDSNLNATAVVPTQDATDTTGTDDFSAVQATNVAFADVNDEGGAGNFQQLNASDDKNSSGTPDADERLSALSGAIGGPTVTADVARVVFTPTNASKYTVEAVDSTGANIAIVGYTATASANVINNVATATDFTFKVNDTNQVVLLFTKLKPGDVVQITPSDDLGHAGTMASVTLADTVEPTTVLQNSYGVTPNENGQVTSVDFGNGGELVSVGVVTIGTPYLNITPMLLDNLDNAGDSINKNTGAGADNTLTWELMDLNQVNTTTSQAYIARAAGLYDSVAYAAMNTTRTMGVAMSEDIAVAGTPVFTGTNAALSAFAAHNDVIKNDEGIKVYVDLVDMSVDDVIALAADDGSTINYTSIITDNAGNTAGTGNNAVVVIRDAMPPMIASAIYNGSNITVTFNEAVTIDFTADTITLGALIIGLTNASLDGTGTVLTILPEDDSAALATGAWIDDNVSAILDGYGDIDRATEFALAQYTETGLVINTQSPTDAQFHSAMTFNNIEDASNLNDWTADKAGITIPQFAAIDATGNFQVSSAAPVVTAANVATGTSYSYTFTHPLNFQAVFGGCGGSLNENGTTFTLDQVGVLNCYTVNGLAPDSSTGLTYTKATNTLTVNLTYAAAVATNLVAMTANAGVAVGEYDAADTFTITDVTLQ